MSLRPHGQGHRPACFETRRGAPLLSMTRMWDDAVSDYLVILRCPAPPGLEGRTTSPLLSSHGKASLAPFSAEPAPLHRFLRR